MYSRGDVMCVYECCINVEWRERERGYKGEERVEERDIRGYMDRGGEERKRRR